MVNGSATREAHDAHDRLLVPGQADRSIILNRLAEDNGYSRMPPFGSTIVDQEGAQLLRDWIEQELVTHQTYDEWRIDHFGDSTSPEGNPEFDYDFDGGGNYYEFLTRTDPSSSLDRYRPIFSIQGDMAVFKRPSFSQRRVIVETSTDLLSWEPWDIPNNTGTPLAPSSVPEWKAAVSERTRFFRLSISEE
jgi:hypothetical protein